MGAEFCTLIVKGQDKNQTKKIFKQAQKDDLYENGHSYSGGFGMAPGLEFKNEIFNNRQDAEDYLFNTCKKWEPALVVSYKDKDLNINFLIGAICSS